jgi:hypothetical protein
LKSSVGWTHFDETFATSDRTSGIGVVVADVAIAAINRLSKPLWLRSRS